MRFFYISLLAASAFLAAALPARAQDIIASFEESQALGDRLGGKLEKREYPAPALGNHATRRVYVYTPPGYTGIGSRTYPVLFLLHGAPGDPAEWLYRGGAHRTIDALIKSGRVPPFIAIFPDGRGPFYKNSSDWADAVNNKCSMETATARDLPAWLRDTYRVSPNPAQWAIGGLSEGGYGAANLLVRHPDTFRSALVFSGEFAVSDDWPDAKPVFGTDPKVRAANSPLITVKRLPADVRSKLFFYLAVGQDDAEELLAENETFAVTCKTVGVPVTLDADRGGHKWGFWSSHLKTGLAAWAKRLAGAN